MLTSSRISNLATSKSPPPNGLLSQNNNSNSSQQRDALTALYHQNNQSTQSISSTPNIHHPQTIQIPMLGTLQVPQPQQNQGGQQQQGQPGQSQGIPPPPPQNGQDFNLSSVLHFLQTEWRRYERDRNEWEIERAEMRVSVLLIPMSTASHFLLSAFCIIKIRSVCILTFLVQFLVFGTCRVSILTMVHNRLA
jgi:striatin 1/3/4